MKIILGQFDTVWENRSANLANLRRALEQDPPMPQSLLVLPEMFSVGFSMNVKAIAEPYPQETQNTYSELAEKYGIFIVGGIVSQAVDGRGLNQASVIAPTGAQITRYTKIHPFSFASENAHYDPGKDIVTFMVNDVSVSPFICYDLRFPEIFRHAVKQGARVLAVIANWPAARVHHWVTLLQARAIENQCYVIGVNRVGSDPNVEYPGRSLVIDPRGKVVLDAGDKAGLYSIEIDIKELIDYRAKFPALNDIRPEFLGLK